MAEITSQSSEKKDRGAKLAHCQRMPSIEAVVIVSHREKRVDVHRRGGSGWHVETAFQGSVKVTQEITIDVDQLYRSAEGL